MTRNCLVQRIMLTKTSSLSRFIACGNFLIHTFEVKIINESMNTIVIDCFIGCKKTLITITDEIHV